VSFLAPNIYPVYEFIAKHVGTKLSVPTTIQPGSTFDEFERGAADVGFICGLPYVILRRRVEPPVDPLAAPVLQGPRYGGRPVYYSDVIVRRGDMARSFDDLEGRSWAYNDLHSHSGYNLVRYRLIEMGRTRGFFSAVVEAGFHQAAIRLVASGAVDAAAIDSQVLAVELRDHPDLDKAIEVIDSLGPSTIQPVVTASRLPQNLTREIRQVLLEMHLDPLARARLDRGCVRGFAPIDDDAYGDIRHMLESAERANFMALR
jgi:phosphonate transport system substrate-binding protein